MTEQRTTSTGIRGQETGVRRRSAPGARRSDIPDPRSHIRHAAPGNSFNLRSAICDLKSGSLGRSTIGNRTSSIARAFSLIELMVVIAIIALLVGLGIPAANKMMTSSEAKQMQASLTAYAGAVDSYQLRTGTVPDHTDYSIPGLEVSEDDADDTTTGLFLTRTYQLGDKSPTWRMILSAAKEDTLTINPGNFSLDQWSLEDLWGNKLRYTKGVSHDDAFTDDDFLPANPSFYFASAGPDGQWGDEQERLKREAGKSYNEDLAEQTEDNIYSFDMD